MSEAHWRELEDLNALDLELYAAISGRHRAIAAAWVHARAEREIARRYARGRRRTGRTDCVLSWIHIVTRERRAQDRVGQGSVAARPNADLTISKSAPACRGLAIKTHACQRTAAIDEDDFTLPPCRSCASAVVAPRADPLTHRRARPLAAAHFGAMLRPSAQFFRPPSPTSRDRTALCWLFTFFLLEVRKNWDLPCDAPLHVFVGAVAALGLALSLADFFHDVFKDPMPPTRAEQAALRSSRKRRAVVYGWLLLAVLVWGALGTLWVRTSTQCARTAPQLYRLALLTLRRRHLFLAREIETHLTKLTLQLLDCMHRFGAGRNESAMGRPPLTTSA